MPSISTRAALVAQGVTAAYINELAAPRQVRATTASPRLRTVSRRLRDSHARRQPAGLTVSTSREGRAAPWYRTLIATTPSLCTD